MIDTKYISPEFNNFRKEFKITEEELVSETGMTEAKLHRILYDRPNLFRGSFYPISPSDKDKLIEAFKKLAKSPLDDKDLNELFIARHQNNRVDSRYDEAIFNWFFKERIDVDIAMQLLLYFDIYDSVDNLTAQIALFYIHMNDNGKEKTRQKSFPLSAHKMKCYAFSNYEKISKLKAYWESFKTGEVRNNVQIEIDALERKRPQKAKEAKEKLAKQFFEKIGLGISENYYFEEPKRNNSFKNAVDTFDLRTHQDNALLFTLQMELLTCEECQADDVWDLIISCSYLHNPDKQDDEQKYLLEYLDYAQEIFEQNPISEDALKSYYRTESGRS